MCCLISKYLVNLQISLVFFNSIMSREYTLYDLNFFTFVKNCFTVYLVNITCVLENNVYFSVVWSVLQMPMRLIWLIVLFGSFNIFAYFLSTFSIIYSGRSVTVSKYNCRFAYLSFHFFQFLFHFIFKLCFRCMHTKDYYVLLMNPYISRTQPNLSSNPMFKVFPRTTFVTTL